MQGDRDPLAEALAEWLCLSNTKQRAAECRAFLARHGLAVVPVGMLIEAADEIAAYVDAEYAVSTGGPHTAVARKYERDMSLPRELRAMLPAAQEPQR